MNTDATMLIPNIVSVKPISTFANEHYLILRLDTVFHFLIAGLVFLLFAYLIKNNRPFLRAFTYISILICLKEFSDFILWLGRDILPPISFTQYASSTLKDLLVSFAGVFTFYFVLLASENFIKKIKSRKPQ